MRLSKAIRETHLTLAAFMAPLLAVYIISALVMEQPFFEISRINESQFNVELPFGVARSASSVAEFLNREKGISGEITSRREKDGAVSYNIKRLGSEWKVSLAWDSSQIEVQQYLGNVFRYLDRIHRHSGVRHGNLALNLWGILAGCVAVSLFIFGCSGIYLWFLLVKERRIGLILLCGHAAITILVLGLVRLA